MRTEYVDKHEEKLKEAISKAGIIPSDIRWKISSFKFLGAVERPQGGYYYYYHDEVEERYYYESDFDREMRAILKRKKFQKHAKK